MTVGELVDILLAKAKAGEISTETPIATLSECGSCYGPLDEEKIVVEVGQRTTHLPSHTQYSWGAQGQVVEKKVEGQTRDVKTVWLRIGEVVLDSSRRLPIKEEPF